QRKSRRKCSRFPFTWSVGNCAWPRLGYGNSWRDLFRRRRSHLTRYICIVREFPPPRLPKSLAAGLEIGSLLNTAKPLKDVHERHLIVGNDFRIAKIVLGIRSRRHNFLQ